MSKGSNSLILIAAVVCFEYTVATPIVMFASLTAVMTRSVMSTNSGAFTESREMEYAETFIGPSAASIGVTVSSMIDGR